MPFLPAEIVREILRRLPVKSLLRFRSVSKSWRSLIDDKQFIQLHLHHSLRSNSNLTLLVYSSRLYYVDLDSFKLLQVGDARVEPSSVIATCDGLVLLVPTSGDCYLWNPATRKHRMLPAEPPTPNRIFCSEYVDVFFALGYDSEHDDYKVVTVTQAAQDGDGGVCPTATSIYSLKANSWKRGKDFPYLLPRRWGVYLNGALHTIVEHGSKREAMMAFDLGKEEHHELPMPPYRRAGAGHRLACAEKLGGCLAATVAGENRTEIIWLMKEYGVKQSWMQLLRVDPLMMGRARELQPLVYSKNGEEVLLNNNGMYLSWHNLRKETAVIARVSGISASFSPPAEAPVFDVEVCVGSLVSPFSPAEKEAQKKHKSPSKVINKKRDDFLSTGFKLRL